MRKWSKSYTDTMKQFLLPRGLLQKKQLRKKAAMPFSWQGEISTCSYNISAVLLCWCAVLPALELPCLLLSLTQQWDSERFTGRYEVLVGTNISASKEKSYPQLHCDSPIECIQGLLKFSEMWNFVRLNKRKLETNRQLKFVMLEILGCSWVTTTKKVLITTCFCFGCHYWGP